MFELKRYVNINNQSIYELIPLTDVGDQVWSTPLEFIPDMIPMEDFVFLFSIELPIPIPNMYGIPSINLVEIKIPLPLSEASSVLEAFSILDKKIDEIEKKIKEQIEASILAQNNKIVTPQDLTRGAGSKLQIAR